MSRENIISAPGEFWEQVRHTAPVTLKSAAERALELSRWSKFRSLTGGEFADAEVLTADARAALYAEFARAGLDQAMVQALVREVL